MGAFINLENKTFGRLKVLKRDDSIRRNKKVYWICKCSCGNLKSITAINLKSNATLSCGCLRRELVSKRRSLNLENQRFGKLNVIRQVKVSGSGLTHWLCKCDCGNEKIIVCSSLVSGLTHSCGCIRKFKIRTIETNYNAFYIGYKSRAKRNFLNFSLSKETFFKIISSPCFYCNNVINRRGLDRVDSNKGYELENIVPCCSVCNIAKSSLSLDDFLTYLDNFHSFSDKPSIVIKNKFKNINYE